MTPDRGQIYLGAFLELLIISNVGTAVVLHLGGVPRHLLRDLGLQARLADLVAGTSGTLKGLA